ncbi:uncharacterized protein ACRADG_004991 [Cochliomyia hominivorax]
MNKEADLEFIKLVQSYPIIYDREQSRGQKNSNMKNEAWQEIAQIVKKSEIACITRWKSIRDRFGKEYRRQQENAQDTTNWELFPHLMFLKDHYKQGTARNDVIETIKYTPRVRKTKPKKDYASTEEEDIKPEELALNKNIIALVKQHDVLYDRKRVRDSKNLAAKNEAWSFIASALDVSEQECYTKWKKLRDRFSREYRQLQLNPEKPITWIYFDDLKFLQSHYRKGIPLPVEEIKCRAKQSPANNDSNPWGDDLNKSFGYSDTTVEQHIEDQETEDSNDHLITEETEMNDFDELLYIAPKKQCLSDSRNDAPIQVSYHISPDLSAANANQLHQASYSNSNNNSLTNEQIFQTTICETASTEAEQKLQNVINNMECVLRQSQDCLKAVQQQKEIYKQEILQKNNSINLQTDMLQKVHVLLDGLQPDQRNKAERKILQFLCECQIKILNNEEIIDVKPVNIY